MTQIPTQQQLMDMVSEKRLEALNQASAHRQLDLTLVIENIHDEHNVAAIFRSADAVGIDEVQLLYTRESFPVLHPKVTASGGKWVTQTRFDDPHVLTQDLRSRGFKLYATSLTEDAISIHDVDWTEPSAIIFGNEKRGVSSEMTSLADKNIHIPMFGMVESLNVSVATAVILFEACRQRIVAGKYPNSDLEPEWLEKRMSEWIRINQPKISSTR